MALALVWVIGAAVLTCAAVAAGGYWAIFVRPLPRTSGHLRVAGPASRVIVDRDASGVPTITAESEADAAFGLGLAHGQDRLWQMEMGRRMAAGRLSEVLGPRALPADRLMRRLGLRRVSEAEWHVTLATGEVRQLLVAYAAGVNAAIADRPLPAEFTILRHRPEPWEPEDSLALGRLHALGQAREWQAALVRMRLLKVAGPELTAALTSLVGDVEGAAALAGLSAWTCASSVWAAPGKTTAKNRAPLLAVDLHSTVAVPGPFHQARSRAGGGDLAGFTVPGLPFFVAGQNAAAAWGAASAHVRTQDLYVERFNPNNPLQFEDRGGWEDAVRFRETIRVRGADAVVEDVLVTRRGPVISPALPGRQPPLSLRWVALDSEVDSVGWMLQLQRCRDWPSFRAAVGACAAPSLAVVYADVEGNVGCRLSAFVPVRASGDGALPAAGWDGSGEWVSFRDFNAMPEVLNPASGLVVAANAWVEGWPGADEIAHDSQGGSRARRIADLLASADPLDVDACRRLQADVLSLPALRLRDLVVAALDGSDAARAARMGGEDASVAPAGVRDLSAGARAALELLREWDGRMTMVSPAAVVCDALAGTLWAALLEGRVPPELAAQLDGEPVHPALADGARFDLGSALQDGLSGGRALDGMSADALAAALEEAVREVSRGAGADPRAWRWGARNRVTFAHALGAHLPALRPILDRGPFPVAGSADTVSMVNRRTAGRGARVSMLRAVFDLGDRSTSVGLAVPGQSGHPGSRNYADRLRPWMSFELQPLLSATEAVARRLVVEPA